MVDGPGDGTHWTPQRRGLWQRIAAHPFEAPDVALDFLRRLAREKGWSAAFARGAVAEYRRFCFLAMASGTPVTPSEEVDEVWHLHLVHSRDYWDRWCGEVLGGRLHHDPTRGGPVEQGRFRRQYAETLALYEAYFGPPPEAYWPDARRRFGRAPRFRTVDTDRAVVLPRPRLALRRFGPAAALAGVAMGVAAPAAALPPDPLAWPAAPFLALYVGLLGSAVAAMLVLRRRLRDAGRADVLAGGTGGLGTLELAYLAGGKVRACDAALVELLQRGAADLDARGRRIVRGRDDADLPRQMQALRDCIRGPTTRARFAGAATPLLAPVRRALQDRGLVLAPAAAVRAALVPAAIPLALAGFGAVRIANGVERGHPVGYLTVLVVVTVIVAVAGMFVRPLRTPAGDTALAARKERHARALRAPLDGELSLAVALGGTAILVGTPLAAYAAMASARAGGGGDSGGGGGGDSSGDGGGGDGGGSGCGGCSS